MSLYQQWTDLAGQERSQAEYDIFWKEYFEKEKENYANILENNTTAISGKLSEIAERFKMNTVTIAGFLDGINTSLKKELSLEELTEDSEIAIEIDFEKLYYNMHDAKADWLYNLPQWEDILSNDKRNEITKEYKQSQIAISNKVGRNDPCICGSGKKYKKCCGA